MTEWKFRMLLAVCRLYSPPSRRRHRKANQHISARGRSRRFPVISCPWPSFLSLAVIPAPGRHFLPLAVIPCLTRNLVQCPVVTHLYTTAVTRGFWIPAFAGMTGRSKNDGVEVQNVTGSVQTLIPTIPPPPSQG